ncbi:HTH domain-containing protein [Virgibacillus halophilus]|uniref:HTH domain-containing protein n=1 Tax=Tigheibacillus halophilus TaxID=361280 RepID=A0ABU5CAM9_9BACI|nr:HTH domain-containing protein [Virgibacillus halophilus]
MISLTGRQVHIVEKLMAAASYINVKELSAMFEVSDRTVRYDLDYIEAFFEGIKYLIGKKAKKRESAC